MGKLGLRTIPAVLGFARETDEDLVICVSNLSRFPQSTTIDLGAWEKRVPRDLRGGIPFSVTRTPYTLTLAPYGFSWLEVLPSGAEAG